MNNYYLRIVVSDGDSETVLKETDLRVDDDLVCPLCDYVADRESIPNYRYHCDECLIEYSTEDVYYLGKPDVCDQCEKPGRLIGENWCPNCAECAMEIIETVICPLCDDIVIATKLEAHYLGGCRSKIYE